MNANLTVEILRKAWLIRFLAVVIVAGAPSDFLHAFPLTAADLPQHKVNIAMILANPSTYINQTVSHEGTVQYPKLNNAFSRSGKKECRQSFELADDTGSVAAYLFLYCDVAEQEGLILSQGDRVVVSGLLDFSTGDDKGNFLGPSLKVIMISRGSKRHLTPGVAEE